MKKKQRPPVVDRNCRDLVAAWNPIVGINDSPIVLGVLITGMLRGVS